MSEQGKVSYSLSTLLPLFLFCDGGHLPCAQPQKTCLHVVNFLHYESCTRTKARTALPGSLTAPVQTQRSRQTWALPVNALAGDSNLKENKVSNPLQTP